mgnify:FL=1
MSSVLSQVYKDFELVIIDDGSNDGAEELVNKNFSDPRVVYIRQEHLGLSQARNNGIGRSSGELIAFLDADDIYLPDKLEKQVSMFEKMPAADLIYSSEKYFYEDDKDRFLDSPYEKLSGDIFVFLKRSNFIHVSTVMLKRAALNGLVFDTSLKSHEDWDFFLKLSAGGVKFYHLAEPLALIRVRRSSMTAVSPVMDSSRRIVGERAKAMWKEMKARSFLRYVSNRVRAGMIRFPTAPKFNKEPVHKEIVSER